MSDKPQSNFVSRHIGPNTAEQDLMLKSLACKSLDELVRKTIPSAIMIDHELKIAAGIDESQVLARAQELGSQNILQKNYLGQGYYNVLTPSVLRRCILENPSWYTAYTPYQAEISQGRMEALLNFQTMVCDLTGMEIANASLLDEATAAAEAMHMAHAVQTKNTSRCFFVDQETWPQTLDVIKTRAKYLNIEVLVGNLEAFCQPQAPAVFGAYIQQISRTGAIKDRLEAYIAGIHQAGALAIVGTDPLALTITTAPGTLGADIVVGSAQRFGVPMMFGGPHAAYLATKDEFKRHVPGRFIGVSIDAQGQRALRMALQTREQHIRREKATSNICTSQVLLAVMASMYAVYHGPEGLRGLAARIHGHARTFTKSMELLQLKVSHYLYFDTVKIQTPKAKLLVEAAMKEGINLYWDGSDAIQVSFDETHEAKDIVALVALMARVLGVDGTKALAALHGQNLQNFSDWPKTMLREGDKLLPYEAFRSYHTETKMMRYINWLERKDLTLTQAMIPLGSCTMKLNAGTELTPVTWPAFADVHPHAPKSQTLGYQTMIRELSEDLAEITGFHAVSLQPNAGSQGEYAGLLVVRRMFESIGQNHRDICLIPQSAHGTNPASAVMAGLEVVIVKCDQNGNVDTVDLTQKAEKYRDRLCALMVTYPSTHGVFEESIKDICQTIHRNGGRVYLDGANMNALVGLCRPGDFGADVCHLNLHKTFAIPHGGGGPGVGPIGVTKELSPFLPAHVWDPSLSSENAIGAVAAAPYGSAGVLPISWSYIKMMGSSGLKLASEIAILNANYVAKRLEQAYPVLYKGKQGFVAHECILDLRGFKKSAGIEPDDVAKRLMDYGFHAPTMSWPVPGTLMIEPTESESLDELDRFCEAMLKIRQEIAQIENGTWPKDNNPLSHAPHTAQLVSSTEWTRPYTREVAAYPADGLRTNKYWPTVARVDGPYGDRNFVCSCPSLSSYE